MREEPLKIAIQKNGRLSQPSVDLLRRCDIGFDNGEGKLKAHSYNFPLEMLFLRDDDIPQCIDDGVVDIGIVGENILAEAGSDITPIERLGFGKCRLSLAVPRGFEYSGPEWFNNKRIATSYPQTLKRFLRERQINAEIHSISGSVEIATGIGLADAICDLVSSGSTLFTNGLKEVETVMESEAVLVSRNNLTTVTAILEKLVIRIRAVNAARQNKYILLNAPNKKLPEIESLLPGMQSPTVMPLAQKGWSSVHSVIGESDYWDVVDRLKAAGAQGILVISIDQMIR